MRELVRVLVVGTGQMGSGVAQLLLQKQGVAVVGACARRRDRAGVDLGPAIGLDNEIGIPIENDLAAVAARTRPDVAIQTTCSRLADAVPEIEILAAQGVHVISIAEEMAYPAAASPSVAGELRRLARRHEIAILGTGVNPGFVLDLLLIALSGVCADVRSIRGRRVNDLSPYGPTVLATQGVGLTPSEFAAGLRNGTVVGHFGFAQSVHMIGDALGWKIDRIEEARSPIVSNVRRATPHVTVEPGNVAGCLHTATAYSNDERRIELVHPQQIHPHVEGIETGDFLEIIGTPNVRLSGSPEIPGGVATVALAVNSIPRVLAAPPGLYSMKDLPVPAAILGDARRSLEGRDDC